MPFPTDRSFLPAAALLPLLLAGCVQAPVQLPPPEPAPAPPPVAAPEPPPVLPPAPPPPEDQAARRLLAFHERLRTLPPADLAREAARLQNPVWVEDTLELALLLAQQRGPGDLARALALLDPIVRDGASPLAPLARLLQGRIAEQRRLEELAERQAQQLREQQRRIEQLGQQIEQLRAIERSLGTRPPAASAPR
jgi:hypothetical protein